MTRLRVTRIVCVVCNGEGALAAPSRPTCYGCGGAGRLPVADALALAERRHRLACGGLASGDYPANIVRRLIDEAEAVYAIAGVTPPWAEGAA